MRNEGWSVCGAVVLVCGAVTIAVAQSHDGGGPETLRHRMDALRSVHVVSEGGSLGITVRDPEAVASRSGTAAGVRVETVRTDSAAERAGIRTGDVISQFDGVDVRSARQLVRLVAETPPGRTVAVAIDRDGQRQDVEVAVERVRPRGLESLRDLEERFDFALPDFELPDVDVDVRFRPGRLGVGVQDLRGQLAEYFGVAEGVLVTDVRGDSPAAAAGVKAGDVIVTIDKEPIVGVRDLQRRVRRAEGRTVALGITRDRESTTVDVSIPPSPRRSLGEPL